MAEEQVEPVNEVTQADEVEDQLESSALLKVSIMILTVIVHVARCALVV